jgi:hypothetical protein
VPPSILFFGKPEAQSVLLKFSGIVEVVVDERSLRLDIKWYPL